MAKETVEMPFVVTCCFYLDYLLGSIPSYLIFNNIDIICYVLLFECFMRKTQCVVTRANINRVHEGQIKKTVITKNV